MYDYHMHSVFSLDVDAETGSAVEELCREAIKKGFKEIAITDHCDIDNEYYGQCEKLDTEGVYRAVFEAKEIFRGELNVLFGIELGQPHHLPKLSGRLTERFPFDYIIGSVHSVREIIDFSFHDFTVLTDGEIIGLWEKYLKELEEIIAWGKFCSLAHITYPYRYICYAGRGGVLDLNRDGRDMFEAVLKKLIQSGISLEVNTSGLRQNLNDTLPGADLIKYYKQLGGELITVGSDAHNASQLGAGIKQTYRTLKDIGYKYITRYDRREPFFEKLN